MKKRNGLSSGNCPSFEESELCDIGRIMGWAFNYPPEDARVWVERAGVENLRLARRAGDGGKEEIAGGLLMLPAGQWFGGRAVPMAGIAGVAVAPQYRRRGVAAELMRDVLAESRDAGMPLSTLYPASVALYRRFGYELAGSRFWATLDPADIDIDERTRTVRPVTPEDEPALAELYNAWACTEPGNIDRTEYFWRRVRCWRGQDAHGFVVSHNGAIEGYLYYLQGMSGDVHKQYLQLTDCVASTPEAGRQIMKFLADHRSLVGEVRFGTGPVDPWLMQMPENTYTLRMEIAWMVRVLDVAAALEARGYPPQLSAELHLEIADDLLKDNAGCWLATFEGGRCTVRRGGEGRLRLEVRALAAVYTGYVPATALLRSGQANGEMTEAAVADAVFAGPAPWMRDMF